MRMPAPLIARPMEAELTKRRDPGRRGTMLALSGVAAAAVGVAMVVATAMPSGAATTPASDTGAGVLAASAGCGKTPTLTNGTHTIVSNGTQRSFVLRLPGNYDNTRPYRLIFGFHWLGGNAGNVVSGDYYGLGSLSNNSAIFVAPEGLNNGWANSGGADVTFTDNMISRITNDLCVDTSLLFSLGFSYGGGMSYALACARANVFRAVAIYAGGVISGCNGGTQPIAYMQAHGLSDNVLGISGARSMRDRFVSNNGCTPANPPEPTQGSGRHTSYTYSGCRAGYPVAWHAFDGGHIFDPRDAGSSTSWLPGETWRFFTQFQSSVDPGPTTTPSVTPTTATPPPSGGCTATYRVVSHWTGGFQGEVTVRNGTSATAPGWTATFTFSNGQQITQAWGATVSQSGTAVTARGVSWNSTLPAGGTATLASSPPGPATTPHPR
jgi:poly(3-hydroxybutyrate) depolymerase